MRFHYLVPGLLAALLSPDRAAAQTTDSARVRYSEEQAAAADSEAGQPRIMRQERAQWKLGLNNFTLGQVALNRFYTRYGVHVAYERQLSPQWTVQGEVSPAVVRYRRDDGALWRAPSARVQLMGRYYYNQERRIRQGKNLGSFSGNYLALATGAGLGRQTRDTPFYYYFAANDGPNRGIVDVALLYGLQRRVGRRGFVDVNAGITKLLAPISGDIALNASLRVGLVLGGELPPEQLPVRLGAADDAALRPRYYVGAQLGSYNYVVRFADSDPYAARPGGIPGFAQRPGVGRYSVEIKNPYIYAGYQLRPRLAVQLGYQGQASTGTSSGGTLVNGTVQLSNVSETYQQTLAFPLLLRYALMSQYQQRVQLDAVGGVAVVHARVRNQETRYENGQPAANFAFDRRTTGGHLMAGLNVGYGIGRQRRLQLTGEYVLIQSLQTAFRGLGSMQSGGSLGLRYRFGPTF